MRRPVLALLTSLAAVVLLAGCDPAPVSVSVDDDFNTATPGSYQFRASLKRTASTASSGFSDPQSITVS